MTLRDFIDGTTRPLTPEEYERAWKAPLLRGRERLFIISPQMHRAIIKRAAQNLDRTQPTADGPNP